MSPSIFVCGRMGSGKTTTANHLRDKHGYEIISLARPVKEMERRLREESLNSAIEYAQTLCDSVCWVAKNLMNMNPELSYGHILDMKNRAGNLMREVNLIPVEDSPKQRARLQAIGHGMREKVTKDFWIFIVLLVQHNHPETRYVCDDVRYVNEATLLSNSGWQGIILDVSAEVQAQRLTTLFGQTGNTNHAGEMEFYQVKELGVGHDISGDLPMEEMLAEIDKVLGL